MLRWISWLFFLLREGCARGARHDAMARRSRRCRLRSRRAATRVARCRLSAVTSFLVVMVPGSDGGVTVGYASHSCRGRRTETIRRRRRSRVARHCPACLALSFPFPSLPASFSLSLFLFPFFSSFHPALVDDDGHGHGEFRVAVSRQRNTSSCYSSHTLQDVPYVRRDTSVCFCPATAKSRVSCVTLNYPLAVRLEDHR